MADTNTIVTTAMLTYSPELSGQRQPSGSNSLPPAARTISGAVAADQGNLDAFASMRGSGAIAGVAVLGVLIVALLVFIVVMLVKVYRAQHLTGGKAARPSQAGGSQRGSSHSGHMVDASLASSSSLHPAASSHGSLSVRSGLASGRRSKAGQQWPEAAVPSKLHDPGHVSMMVKPHVLPLDAAGRAAGLQDTLPSAYYSGSGSGYGAADHFALRQPGDSLQMGLYRGAAGPAAAHPLHGGADAGEEADDKSSKLLQLQRQESFVAVRLTTEDDQVMVAPPASTYSRPGLSLFSRELLSQECLFDGPGDSGGLGSSALRTGGSSYAGARRSMVASRRTLSSAGAEEPQQAQQQQQEQQQQQPEEQGANDLFLSLKGGSRAATRTSMGGSLPASRRQTDAQMLPLVLPRPSDAPLPGPASGARRTTDGRPAHAGAIATAAFPGGLPKRASSASGARRTVEEPGYAAFHPVHHQSRRSTAQELAEQAADQLLSSSRRASAVSRRASLPGAAGAEPGAAPRAAEEPMVSVQLEQGVPVSTHAHAGPSSRGASRRSTVNG